MTTSAKEEQKLRRALVGSTGSTTFNTYGDRAEADLQLENQGRHAAAAKASVTGAKASVQYPRQPSTSPWHSDIVPPEPSLGYAIDAQECVGEVFEIAASLPSGAADEATEVDFHSASGAQAPADGLVSRTAGASLRRGRKL